MAHDITREVVENNLIFLGTVGSHAYGTDLPDSDHDEAGVCIIPYLDYYYGQREFHQFQDFFDAAGNKIDKTVFSLQKIIVLALDNNPNILDYLALPDRCIIKTTPAWDVFRQSIDKILCSRVKHSFTGYAMAQIKRVEIHRQYLLNPKKLSPTRQQFGLPEESIFPETQMESIAKISTSFVAPERQGIFYNEAEKILLDEFYLLFAKYMHRDMVTLAINDFRKDQMSFLRLLGSLGNKFLKEEYAEGAKKELSYRLALADWRRYREWEKTRNPKRQVLERKCGYDSKYLSHALRLSRMGKEILLGKGIRVDRTGIDADELRDIRLGNQRFEDVMRLVEKEMDEVESLYDTTSIRKTPDREFINEMVVETIDRYLRN